jgi:preprotein translocase subunit YajC
MIMPGLLDVIPLIFAQAAPPAAPQAEPSLFTNIGLPLLMIVPLFYFMIIRPNQQQEKQRRQMIDALKKNDKVLTTAGIYGTVMSVDPDGDRVVLRIDDDRGVKVAFSRASVAKVIEVSTEKDKPAEAVSPGAAPK